jgi:hypothetical protein
MNEFPPQFFTIYGHFRSVADRGDPGLNGPAIPDTATETSSCADDTAAFSHSLGHLPTLRYARAMSGLVDTA